MLKYCCPERSPTKFEVLPTPVKSDSDKKQYKTIKLENGLVALLISDPNRDPTITENEKKAASSLSVGVGSFSDPKDVPGMSHFLEHMVMMGSEKYPSENDFEIVIQKSGGTSNAGTMDETTVFYFDCVEKHLKTCLDREVQFFISPLMKKDAISREREAVDSEFQMNAVPSDNRRQEMLLLSLSKKDIPINIFSWGNLKTLKNDIDADSLYQKVHEYRRRHYSAHRMTLTIQASLPLVDLQNIVLQLFSSIPNNHLPPLDFSEAAKNMFDTPEFNKIYYIKPIQEVTKLKLTWSLPSLQKKYKNKVFEYLAHVIGDEGKGSILSRFKKHLWATRADAEFEDNSVFSIFGVTISLTEEGLQHLHEVVESVFAYIKLIKKTGPSKRIFDELKTIYDASFKFANEDAPIDNVKNLSEYMQIYPPQDYLCGQQLFQEYDPEIIKTVLDRLTPSKVNIMVTTKTPPKRLKFNQVEKWLGAEYVSVDIPENIKTKWETIEPYPEYAIAPPNPYVSNNFTILPETPNNPEYPQQIINNPKCELWYKKDQTFKLPNAHYHFYLISPSSLESPKSASLLTVFLQMLKFYMGEEAYPAEAANLEYKLFVGDKGLIFSVTGFHEKIPVLIDVGARYIRNLKDKISEESFNEVKTKVLNNYYNLLLKPSNLGYQAYLKLSATYWSALDKYNALLNVTYEDMKEFLDNYRKELYVKALIQGNVTSEVAKDTVNKFVDVLDYEPLPKNKFPTHTTVQYPLGEKFLLLESFNKKDANNFTSNHYQIGPNTIKDKARILTVLTIIREPLFDVLRTKEALGYQVGCNYMNTYNILGFSVEVYSQETKFTTQHLDTRIEAFLKSTKKILEDLSLEDFEKIREEVIKSKTIPDFQLQEEVDRNWIQILLGTYQFDTLKQQVEEVKTIKLEELKIWWDKLNRFAGKENFRKISLQVAGHIPEEGHVTEEHHENVNISGQLSWPILKNSVDDKNKGVKSDYIENIETFQTGLTHFPTTIK